MAIDKPPDAIDQQNRQDAPELPRKVALTVAKVGLAAIPMGGVAAEILLKVAEALKNESLKNRMDEMWDLIRKEFAHVDNTKASRDDVVNAIQKAIWDDAFQRDNKKRERYVKLIGNAVRSEEQIQGVASLIQTIEQLNENDILVLRVLTGS